jgi:hypothetical protein
VTDFMEGLTEDAKAQLLRAKDLTRRTGTLIEAQVLQLRLWPQVAFNVLDATIDPLDIEGKTVNYMLRVKTFPKTKDVEKRANVVADWVRTLLGDDWAINVRFRQKKGGPGKLMYRGERKRPVRGDAKPQADLPGYEFTDAMTEFKRYRLRDQQAAFEAASAKPAPIPPPKEKKA